MKDKKERFHQELKELLTKHDCFILSSGDVITVTFNYDKDRDEEPTSDLILGAWEDGVI